jgi:hypothetical protein
MINDLKLMLDSFNIPWIEAPAGFEAEQLAAYLTNNHLHGIKADAVLTPDPDCLLFGARMMIKNDKQKFYKYQLASILHDNKISHDDLIKIGVILGCDFADKTPGVGPGTVLKKQAAISLTDRQISAVAYFIKPICSNILANIKWQSSTQEPFTQQQKILDLFKWMTEIKGFSIPRTESRFKAAKLKVA